MPKHNETALMTAIANYPLSLSVDASNDAVWQDYSGGVVAGDCSSCKSADCLGQWRGSPEGTAIAPPGSRGAYKRQLATSTPLACIHMHSRLSFHFMMILTPACLRLQTTALAAPGTAQTPAARTTGSSRTAGGELIMICSAVLFESSRVGTPFVQ